MPAPIQPQMKKAIPATRTAVEYLVTSILSILRRVLVIAPRARRSLRPRARIIVPASVDAGRTRLRARDVTLAWRRHCAPRGASISWPHHKDMARPHQPTEMPR